MKALRDVALIYGSALILSFFSEMLFFNEGPAYSVIGLLDDPLLLVGHLVELGLWYSVVAAPVLWAMWRFNVHSIWGLFLVGCLFGFLIEGLVVPAIYFELPNSLLWVATTWHPLICVMLGWWGVRRIMQRGSLVQTISLMVVLGLFWGTWTTILIGAEVDQEVAGDVVRVGETFEPIPIAQFAAFTFITTTVWAIGNLLVDRVGTRDYQPGRIQQIVIALIALAALGLMAMTVQVLVAVLGVAVLLLWLGLARNARVEARPNIFSQFTRIPLLHHSLIYITPAVGTLTYDTMISNGWVLEPMLYIGPVVLVGAVMLPLSFVRLFMLPRVDRPETE